jgi:hypothetical protein
MALTSYLADIEERRIEDLQRAEADRLRAYEGPYNWGGAAAVCWPTPAAAPARLPKWRAKQLRDAAREEARRVRDAIGNALWFKVTKDVQPLRKRT